MLDQDPKAMNRLRKVADARNEVLKTEQQKHEAEQRLLRRFKK